MHSCNGLPTIFEVMFPSKLSENTGNFDVGDFLLNSAKKYVFFFFFFSENRLSCVW